MHFLNGVSVGDVVCFSARNASRMKRDGAFDVFAENDDLMAAP